MSMHAGQVKSGPWLLEASQHLGVKFKAPETPSKGLDALGFDQKKLNGNFMSWMDQLSDQDKHEGNQWYPAGNDWGHHAAELHQQHPDKVFGVMSKTSPQRDWYSNLGDTENIVGNHRHNPHEIVKPGGISGSDNLRQALRVMDAHDDPESIHSAFLGTKNVKRKGQPVAVPRNPADLPKTYDFMRTLRDPEAGGAGNYGEQPGVVDSWMGRTMLWSKQAWDEAHSGGKPLSWPGQGTGEGLDKHLPVKKPNPQTGKWEVVGTKPPSARDVAARVTGMGGGYDRMRNAMRNGAAAHGMPFTHGAQAAVWKAISGNQNPSGIPSGEDPFYIEHPGARWDEMWNRRASGLHVPAHSGIQVASRTAAHGSKEVEDSLDEGWGAPQDVAAILHHISQIPPDWDVWENRPKSPRVVTIDPHRTSAWYTAAAEEGPESIETKKRPIRIKPENSKNHNKLPKKIHQPKEPKKMVGAAEEFAAQYFGALKKAAPPAAPGAQPPGGNWGAMPDIKLGPSAPPGFHPGATPAAAWTSGQAGGGSNNPVSGTQTNKGTTGPDTGGSILPDTAAFQKSLQAQFPQLNNIGGYRPPDGFNEHSSGHALDVMIPDTGTQNTVRNWALKQPNVNYILNQQKQWNPDGSSSAMENRGGATANHFDHLHINVADAIKPLPGLDDSSDTSGSSAGDQSPGQTIARRFALRYFYAADDDDPSKQDQQPGQSSSSPSLPSIGTPTNSAGFGAGSSINPASMDMSLHGPGVGSFTPSFSGGGYSGGGGAAAGGASGTSSPYTGPTPAGEGAEKWRGMVHDEFSKIGPQQGITDPNELKKWEDAAVSRIGIESHGDPNAINKGDSNAIAGHPSQGLLQFIPTSLHQYEPGASMTDPKAEIDAFIPYSKGRGLSPETGLGTAHNY